MKYSSITTENIEHDVANILTEYIWLNHNIRSGGFPWCGPNGKFWGRTVAAIKKLMRPPYDLSAEQIAFYIWKCKPKIIDPAQFAKMAVVAKRLFQPYDIEYVGRLYVDLRKETALSGLQGLKYKEQKPKTLLTFIRELESGKST